MVEDDLSDKEEGTLRENILDGLKKSQLEEKLEEDKSGVDFLLKVLKKIMPMPLNVFVIYVQTFMMFPGITFKRAPLFGLEVYWSNTIILIIFNIFDTVGKSVPNYISLSKI
jgi:equilibrative nucleoside transporter 1/2/3